MSLESQLPGSQITPTATIWSELAPCEHLVQIYETQREFLSALTSFAAEGLNAGQAVVLVATAPHLAVLENRLVKSGYPITKLKSENRYLDCDAHDALKQFMVDGWPDEERFFTFIEGVLSRARGRDNRTIRAFGEMVAILWAEGKNGATVRLEHLWHGLITREKFPLFCAYPRIGFTDDIADSIRQICEAHTKVLGGSAAA